MRSYLWLILLLSINLFAATSVPINQGGSGAVSSATSPLLITDGVLSIPSATGLQSGYLLSTDWSIFSAKQPAGDYVTALTGDVTAAGPGSVVASIADTTVTGKLLTGFSSGAGAVAASDSILTAFNKTVGNLALLAPKANPSFTGTIGTPLTASRVVTTDSSSNLAASSVSTTTLAFLDATSSIQTQLNLKAAKGANTDITSLGGLSTPLSIAQGGTGQGTAANAINGLLPTQPGHSGEFLTTNGTIASWGAGGGGGVSSVDTFSGTSIANGASITGSAIKFGPADGSNPGMVTTGSQTLAGAKTFSGAPTFSASPITLSGGTSTTIARSGKANLKITDSDAYLAVPGFEFYGGAAGSTLMGIWDASQFGLSGNLIFVPSATYDIGSGGFNPRLITATASITTGAFIIAAFGPIFQGLAHNTGTSNIQIGANTHGVIVDPASVTASQTVTLPTSGNSANGEVIKVVCGANGVTSLTIAAGSGTTIVGGGARACIATSFGFIYRSANTTWYPY